MSKSYLELMSIDDFYERIKYLQTYNKVGDGRYQNDRYFRHLNQILYSSYEWKKIRRKVILRDKGFDLGHEDYPIMGYIYIHHINPVTIENILNRNPCVFDLNNLISASFNTHNCIHYGSAPKESTFEFKERKKNDTCPWR